MRRQTRTIFSKSLPVHLFRWHRFLFLGPICCLIVTLPSCAVNQMGSFLSKDKQVHIVRGEPDTPLPSGFPQLSGDNDSSGSSGGGDGFERPLYPAPSGHEFDAIDKLAAKLPQYMDEVTRQRVVQAAEQCRDGKGPMIPCFNHAEFLSQFQRRHVEAEQFFINTCHRPKTDTSPHGVLVDDTKCFPAACFELAAMRMTGKGGTKFDRAEAYQLYDRACRGGHGGACHLQARMLTSYPGQLGPGIPYNPQRAAELFNRVCKKHNDPISCFTLACMYLRGDRVNSEAGHVSPQEARGIQPIETTPQPQVQQESSASLSRKKDPKDERKPLKRDPRKALELLLHGCNDLNHGGSCHNLAVMYAQGDDGVPVDEAKAKYYMDKTEQLLNSGSGIMPF